MPARIAIVASVGILCWVPVFAQAPAPEVAASAAVENPASAPETAKPGSALSAVRRARAMLLEELAARKQKNGTPRRVDSMAVPAEVTIALWERPSDRIRLIEASKSGTSLKIKTPDAPRIKVTYNATIYSQYEVLPPVDAIVVGVIYPVREKVTKGKQVFYDEHETVYVPYSPAFYAPEVLAAGSDYLSFLIQEAFDELKAKGVRSRAFPDRLLTDVVDPYLVKSIVVIEHSDHRSLLSGNDPERTVGRFLVKLATNEDAAFDLALSRAGAAGLVQFIPSTYKLLVKVRPDIGLIPDFEAGMRDHKNAIKAQAALLDLNLADMPADIRALYEKDKVKAGEFMAAAYNGGSVRVKRAWKVFGEKWSESTTQLMADSQAEAATLKKTIAALEKRIAKGEDVKAAKAELAEAKRKRDGTVVTIATLRKSALRDETVWYVAKLRKTYGMFEAGYFATPKAPSGALPAAPAPAAPQPAPLAAAGMICFDDGGCAAAQ